MIAESFTIGVAHVQTYPDASRIIKGICVPFKTFTEQERTANFTQLLDDVIGWETDASDVQS